MALGAEEAAMLVVVDNLENELKALEKQLSQFFALSPEDMQNFNEFDQAKLNIATAYGINTLFYMYLRTQGIEPSTHPVKQELDRVKLYINKIKELTEKQRAKEASLKLNVDAANRFITHALSENNTNTNTNHSINNNNNTNNNNNNNSAPKSSSDKESSRKRK